MSSRLFELVYTTTHRIKKNIRGQDVLKQFVNNSVTSTGRTSILSYTNDIVGT